MVDNYTYQCPSSNSEGNNVPILACEAHRLSLVLGLQSGVMQLRHRDQAAIADHVAESEVRVDGVVCGVGDIPANDTLDAVRAQNNVRLGCCAVLEVDCRHIAVGSQPRTSLVEMCARGVDALNKGIDERGTVHAVQGFFICNVLVDREGQFSELLVTRR